MEFNGGVVWHLIGIHWEYLGDLGSVPGFTGKSGIWGGVGQTGVSKGFCTNRHSQHSCFAVVLSNCSQQLGLSGTSVWRPQSRYTVSRIECRA